jgi:predicted pyridoxine 5'-phosphate oxidase superfamily flavin-nucleotide-binding protein
MSSVFHPGELAVQRRAGVDALAGRLGPRMIQDRIDEDVAGFVSGREFVVVGSSDRSGRVWASVLFGDPGFVAVPSPSTLRIAAQIAADDPLAEAIEAGSSAVGVLAIDPETRSRVRVNGIAESRAGALEIAVRETFGNCPKYIQRRVPGPSAVGAQTMATPRATLEGHARTIVDAADTFFIASRHPERGADASHRGGRPGFVVASDDGRHLTFPDYRGNSMFQTLGNLTSSPAVGLLFVDWENGVTVQLTGRATIVWDEARLAAWPQAERLVEIEIDAVLERADALPHRYTLLEPHRANPEAPLNVGTFVRIP